MPVITYVAPSGARAANAGTYILYASHLAAMAPATNLGAATPIQIAPGLFPGGDRGERTPQDTTADDGKDPNGMKSVQRDKRSSESTLDRKVVNDAVAYIRGLAIMRGRNADWAELAVREAASLTAEEAAHKRVIEIVAKDVDALLRQIDGRQIEVLGQTRTFQTQGLALITIEPDWRSRLLAIITDPNVAYILLLLGIYGLFFELANPGLVATRGGRRDRLAARFLCFPGATRELRGPGAHRDRRCLHGRRSLCPEPRSLSDLALCCETVGNNCQPRSFYRPNRQRCSLESYSSGKYFQKKQKNVLSPTGS